ncbi:MAG: hypothetical protein AB7V19_02445, partial [Candidatus Bipolaricaulia bacterium]
DGRRVGDVRLSTWFARGEVQAGEITYRVHRDATLFRGIALVGPDGVTARAVPLRAFSRAFALRFGDRDFVLRSPAAWFREIRVLEQDRVIGTAVPEGVWSGRAQFDLPEALPIELRLFVVWLALLAWRRVGGSPSFTGAFQVAPWRG